MIFPQELYLPQKTIFRKGAILELPKEVLEFGSRGLIVHGRSFEKSGIKDIRAELFCRASREPTLDEITLVMRKAKEIDAKWIVGIGGGSVLDLAKAAAGLFNAKESPEFYQEGGKVEKKGIPFIAVPTTAGTGSEATNNSVIINKAKRRKLSIRDESFLAKKVILDVDLLKNLPPQAMAYAAMDAFVQAYESFTSRNATWLSETLALKAIELINENILPAYESSKEENLEQLLLGSYLCGIAFGSSRLGVIHGVAHPLGVLYDLPHGLICSILFVPSIKVNREAMGEKYEIMSNAVGMDLIKRIEVLLSGLNISSPFKGKKIIDKEEIINEALASGSTKASPKDINRSDVEFLLGEIFNKKHEKK